LSLPDQDANIRLINVYNAFQDLWTFIPDSKLR
jgi:hypothetical protein